MKKLLLFLMLAMFCLPWALRAQQSLPYSYDFEDNDLSVDGWTLFGSTSSDTKISGTANHDGTYGFQFRYSEENAHLVSPLLTGTTNGVTVSFYYKEYSASYGDEQFYVGYTTDETNEDPTTFTYGSIVTASTSWQLYETTLPAGTKRIAIKYVYNDAFYLYLDDFSFEVPTSCAKPTNLSKSDVTAHTAVLSWTSDVSAWQICLNNDETNLIDVVENPYTLPGLTAETAYTAKVRAVCGSDHSNWTYPISFTTGIACPAPTSLTAVPDGFDATFTWTSGASEWQVAFSTDPAADPTDNVVSTVTEASYPMYDLELGDYYLWVRANCGDEGFSSWAGPKNLHIGYCVPNPSSRDGKGITGVVFGTGENVVNNVDETNGLPSSTPYYGDYSAMVGAVPAGVEATIDITYNTCTSSCYNYGTLIWVDWDNNMTFEDDELVFAGQSTPENNPSGAHTLSATFTIPVDQALGNYRMRIAGADSYFDSYISGTATANHSACFSSTYSVCNDYTLRVLEAPSCLVPTALTLSRDNDEITAVWEGTASSYNIDINGAVTNNVTSPYVFTADLATTYTVKVQTNCGGETSDWSNTQSITTPDCWGGHTIDYTLIDQYNDSWNGASISVIGDCGAYNETLTVASGASPLSGTLNLCGDYYEFIWNKGSYDGECSFTFTEGGTTLFTKPSSVSDGLVLYTIGTQSCPKPTALENEDPEAHSVELSWTENGEATAWQLCVNGDEDNLIDVTENPYILENLTPGTDYSVKVRAKCSPADVSCWSNAVNFTTLPSCIDPTGLEVTANGVDATFTWESEVGSYEIARATTSDANPNEFVVGTADEESYTMNDLDLGDYYLWVRANCTQEDNSSWAGPVSLHIGYCMPANIKRDGKGITSVVFGTGENIVNNVDETNGLPSSSPYFGDYSSMVGAIQAGVESTIAITTSTGSYPYTFVVWVDFDNSLSFEDEEIVYTGKCASGSGTLNATINVPTTQSLGDYRMRIAGADSYFNDFYNNGNDLTKPHNPCNFSSTTYGVTHDYTLRVLEAPSCFAPTDLAVTYEGGTEATVSWTSEATAWNIDVNGTVTAITENPYTLSGLELATNYAVKVQAVCDAATSEWTNPANFSTDLCLPENQCELTFVLTDSYGDGWNGNKIVVTDVATGKVLGELTNENLDGVTQQREENVKTLSVCNGREIQFSWESGNYSYETSYTVYDLNGNEIFSGSGAMTEPVNYTVNCASCAPVTELEASVNGFDVTLTWEPGGSETDWAIRYREEDETTWTTDVNDGPEYQMTLDAGHYVAEVRALCNGDITSGWTSIEFDVVCPTIAGEEYVSVCADSYTWNGQSYTTSGDKSKVFTVAHGCDSVAVLHLTLKQATTSAYETTICSNKFPYTFHGVIFSEAGTQTVTLPGANAVGCDSIMTLTVNMKQTSASSHETTICSNELPYTFHDVLFTAAGTQTKTLTNAVGCDSVVTLTVNVKQTSSFSDEITICDDELPFEFHGVTFQEAGTNNRTLTNVAGCDSVVTLTVNVKYRSYFSDEISVCAADMPYTFHGVQFTVAGTQTKTIPNAAGCDSIMTLTVNVKQPSSFTDTKTVCAEDMPVDWYGHLFTQAGTQTFHSTNAVGCDSTSTLTLYVNTPVHQSYTVDACDSYKWVVGSWSQTYTTPGVKLHSHSDANGCTQVDTLHLTLRHSTTGIDEVTACNSYTWINGTTYTQSTNTPTYTLTNAAGCDSVVTLHLTVNHSRPVSYTITECDSYTWINGITYNASTTATYSHEDVHGCTQVDTLYLTINYSATKDLYDTVCEGKPYYLNGFIIPGSENVEGDHTHTLNLFTINQCDSTVTLHLHVNICDETCGQPITDIDNNSYETMPVHRLCWMTSNLRTTRYSDGTTIPFAIVYSYPYDPNNTDNLMTFGRLYNWTSASKAAAATPLQGVCPDGWRLPTQAEFEELSTFYTETQLRSTDNWIQGAGTNASGFNKQPGGFYNGTTGICERLGASAHFYTADTQANGVIYQISDYSCDSVTYDVTDNPQDGRSIRCVRDLGND